MSLWHAGAVAFNLCTKSPSRDLLQGLILVAPMLKIADDMVLLPACVIDFLKRVIIPCIPYAPLAPVREILPYCFKDVETERRCLEHSLHYDMKPRLGE